MKYFLVLALSALHAPLWYAAAAQEPHALREPDGWFYYHVRLGQPADELNDLWQRFQMMPEKMTGAQIRERVRALSSGNGITKEILPSALRADAAYWFWSHQGPMSDREMFIILAGDSLEEAVVVFAKIEERISF